MRVRARAKTPSFFPGRRDPLARFFPSKRTRPHFAVSPWYANRIVDAGTKGALQVAGISLDELLERENVQRIDFLKMNVEGAEALAIRGMDRTLRITRALSISCHDFRAGAGEGEFFRTRQLISGLRGARRLQNNLARLGPASGHRLPGECPSRLTPLFSTTCCKILK